MQSKRRKICQYRKIKNFLPTKALPIKHRVLWIDYRITATTKSLTLADPPPSQDLATKGVAKRNSGDSTPLFHLYRMLDSKGDVYYRMPRSLTFECEQGLEHP